MLELYRFASPHQVHVLTTLFDFVLLCCREAVKVAIEGEIPSSISSLSKLQVLRLSGSMRTSIPSAIGALIDLRVFSLELDDVYGGLPSSLSKLTSLREFIIASPSRAMEVEGLLPWTYHPTLEVLRLERTRLIGFVGNALPMFQMPSLREITFESNPHLSVVFDQVSLDRLETLHIKSSPSVRGTLSAFLPRLKQLFISSTALSGTLFSTFWTSTASTLESLIIMAPHFSGDLEFGDTCHLINIVLNRVQLVGSISPQIGRCSNLELFLISGCPLSGPLPSELGGLSSLAALSITDARNLGPLPPSLASTPADITITGSGLTGTIPDSFARQFNSIDLSNNDLTGQLPAMRCGKCLFAGNNFFGSIPPQMAQSAELIDLSRNLLGPTIDSRLFAPKAALQELNVTSNRFEGPLPELPFHSGSVPLSIDVSRNKFTGGLPASWSIYDVYANDNELSGNLTQFFANFSGRVLQLSRNRFTGAIPPLSRMHRTFKLDLSHNQFSGGIPPVAPRLSSFSASHNRLKEHVSGAFISSVQKSSLESLDLSYNQLTSPTEASQIWLYSLLHSNLSALDLSHNRFTRSFNPEPEMGPPENSELGSPILMLDLSHNGFSGAFMPATFTSLVSLDLSHNFFNEIALTKRKYPSIGQVDLSHNRLISDVALLFADLPFLYNLKAQNNSIHGRLTLTDLPKLESLDLSDNLLDVEPSWSSIGSHFLNQSLKTLSLVMNPQIPRAQALHTNTTGLAKTSSSSPSRELSGATCFSLSFYNTTNIAFAFDESLFNFVQCDCDHEHFGKPPFWCEQCPSLVDPETGVASGVEECGGPRMLVGLNSFVTAKQVNKSEDGTPVFGFETQSCLYTPDRVLTKVSNCLGLQMTADRLQNLSALPEVLSTQCVLGSEGRLCAECMCDWRSTRPICYYEKAQQCQKCSRVLPSSSFVALIVGGLIAMLVVGTIVVVLVLRSKRVQKRTAWSKLSLLKRLFYRLLFMTSLGNISILLTFVQLFMELTHWDSYAIGRVLQLMNLNGESIGLRCLFPFLSDPVLGLGVRLSLPFVACILVVVCVVLAEVASKLFSMLSEHRSTSSVRNMHLNDHGEENMPLNVSKSPWQDIGSSDFESHGSPSSDIQSDWMTTSTGLTPRDIVIAYPTLAMMTSTLITVTRFLYFGTALTAHEYFFSTMDRQSGAYYVQNAPWILIDTARTQRWLSIPVAILFDAVLPAGFLYLCFRLRHKIGHDETGYYLGTLFTSFKPSFYWWEIVNIAKKVSIALVLRGIPSSNVLQVTLIVTILAGFQVIQTSVSPWRRKTENLLDALGSLVLVGALLAARSGRYENSFVSVYYVVAFSALYVIGSLIAIVYHALTGTTDYERRLQAIDSGDAQFGDKSHQSTGLARMSPWETEDDSNAIESSSDIDTLVPLH